MASSEPVLLEETSNGVRILTLNRPARSGAKTDERR
jgi:hypothetical protein